MSFKKLALAAVIAGLSGAAFATPAITLNPGAANGPQPTVNPGQGSFQTDSWHGDLRSTLDIDAKLGATTWKESGSIVFTEMKLNNVVVNSKVNNEFDLVNGEWDLYGVLLGTGTGFWVTPNIFFVTGFAGFTIDLYAVPGTGSVTFGNPSSGTDATGGVSGLVGAIALGTATIVSAGATTATINCGGVGVPPTGPACTGLSANFAFTPSSPDFVGVGGFFEAPVPFNITLEGAGSSTAGESIYGSQGAGWRIRTGAQGNAGSASTSFIYQSVPEPGMLSLAGLALVGAAVASRRKAKQPVAA